MVSWKARLGLVLTMLAMVLMVSVPASAQDVWLEVNPADCVGNGVDDDANGVLDDGTLLCPVDLGFLDDLRPDLDGLGTFDTLDIDEEDICDELDIDDDFCDEEDSLSLADLIDNDFCDDDDCDDEDDCDDDGNRHDGRNDRDDCDD